MDVYDGSEGSSIGEISEEIDTARFEDTREGREDTTPQGTVYSERIRTKRDIPSKELKVLPEVSLHSMKENIGEEKLCFPYPD